MRRTASLLLALALAGAWLHASPARLKLVESVVERATGADDWSTAREETGFEFGERLRVVGAGLALVRFPWMSLTLGPDAKLSLPETGVLSLALDRGRLAVDSPQREMLRVTTPEAQARGTGRIVLRAEPGRTLVMAHAGRFQVSGGGASVTLGAGEGTIVAAGRRPIAPRALPSPPGALDPGEDALYVDVGAPARLAWTGTAEKHWVELLAVGGDEVLLHREGGRSDVSLRIPWPGAFRWRVASRDADGLEGLPSEDGLVCTVER